VWLQERCADAREGEVGGDNEEEGRDGGQDVWEEIVVRWVFDEGEFEGRQGEEAVEDYGGDGC